MSRALITLTIACLVVESLGQNCSEGDVRLMNGTEYSGRVELCENGTWGTICDRNWDHQDAQVVCNQLNLTHSENLLMGSGVLNHTYLVSPAVIFDVLHGNCRCCCMWISMFW